MSTIRQLILLVIFLGCLIPAFAEVSIGGFIQSDLRVQVQEPYDFNFNRNTFNFSIKSRDSKKIGFCSELEFISQGFHNINNFDDLKNIKNITEYWLDLRSAYIDFYGFIFPQLDLRLGSQIETWGTADKINPTDNINPYDFSDPFDFGRKISNNILKASLYLGNVTLTGALIPVFKPSRLPDDNSLFGEAMDEMLPQGMSLSSLNQNIIMPDKNAKNMSGALKIGANLFDFDLSLSYFYGRDGLPQPTSMSLVPASLTELDISVTLEYPQIHVIGMDFAGALKDVGVWGEGAVIIPEEMQTEISASTPMGTINSTETALKDEPFLKGVLGLDYTFKGGYYVQAQYIHGFIGELGRDNLGDYIMLALEKKFLNDEITIRVAGGVEIQNADRISFIPLPEFLYNPGHGFELSVGAYIIEGDSETTFGKWDDMDQVYLKIKKSF